jgi:hypothetical protein
MIVGLVRKRCRLPLLAVVLVALLGASACTGSAQELDPAASTAERGPAPNQPKAAVYAAVIRQLVLKDHGLGGGLSPYQAVYVLAGPVPGAADPNRPANGAPASRFPTDLKRDVLSRLSDLPPVAFVGQRKAVIAGTPPGSVIHRGVLITLALIRWIGPHEAWVANSRWATGLNGQWLTYRVTFQRSRWTVKGVVGGVAIS